MNRIRNFPEVTLLVDGEELVPNQICPTPESMFLQDRTIEDDVSVLFFSLL